MKGVSIVLENNYKQTAPQDARVDLADSLNVYNYLVLMMDQPVKLMVTLIMKHLMGSGITSKGLVNMFLLNHVIVKISLFLLVILDMVVVKCLVLV